jgi:ATP-dependent RNA helicase HelY
MVGSRIFDLFSEKNGQQVVDPALVRFVDDRARSVPPMSGRPQRGGRRPGGWKPPYRPDVITKLDDEGLLPTIVFIFSRAGCDAAVQQCVRAGLWLTDEDEREQIEQIVDARVINIPDLTDSDLSVLGYWDWRAGLRRGIAAHHAGLIPVFKQIVEELFSQGLVRAVFATETLALGINMPARSVVIERLTKYNGQAHVDLTPGEYTQLTGRAGRRGIDVEGHAVVLWAPDVEPGRVAGLASTRTYPLRSSFRPSYNMAVNLVGQVGQQPARELLESSFAQFQADRGSHGALAQIRKNERTLRELEKQMQCHLGDFASYAALRRELSDRETSLARQGKQVQRASVAQSLEALQPGDVIRIPAGRRAGLAVVLDPGVHPPPHAGGPPSSDPRPLVVTEARWGGRLSLLDFPTPVAALATLRVRKQESWRSPQDRKDIASRIRALNLPSVPPRESRRRGGSNPQDDAEIQRLRAALRAHPCHDCPDREQHARFGERHTRLRRETDSLERRMEGRTGSLGRTFDRICTLLRRRGYLGEEGAAERTTAAGRQLARIWSEADLVVAECLRTGAWDGLNAAELAAVVSSMVFEPRRDERAVERHPTEAVSAALAVTSRIWADVVGDETALGLPASREPQFGFVWPAYRWTRGERLERALTSPGGGELDLSAGDFIRWCKQVLDLLDQVAGAPSPSGTISPLAATALAASTAIRRGVVAQSMAV